jgi:hypothetical protein
VCIACVMLAALLAMIGCIRVLCYSHFIFVCACYVQDAILHELSARAVALKLTKTLSHYAEGLELWVDSQNLRRRMESSKAPMVCNIKVCTCYVIVIVIIYALYMYGIAMLC